MTINKRRLLRGSYQNIINLYEHTPDDIKIEGEAWYPDAHIIARNVGEVALPTHRADDNKLALLGAGIISAFSPQMVWEKNVRAANVFAGTFTKPTWITNRDYDKAINIVKCVRENEDVNAQDILDILGEGAVKTRAFFMNILNPYGDVKENGVTVDRHAIAIYLGEVPNNLQVGRAFSPNGNRQIQNSYKIASNRLGVHHNALQATTWLQWRIEK